VRESSPARERKARKEALCSWKASSGLWKGRENETSGRFIREGPCIVSGHLGSSRQLKGSISLIAQKSKKDRCQARDVGACATPYERRTERALLEVEKGNEYSYFLTVNGPGFAYG